MNRTPLTLIAGIALVIAVAGASHVSRDPDPGATCPYAGTPECPLENPAQKCPPCKWCPRGH